MQGANVTFLMFSYPDTSMIGSSPESKFSFLFTVEALGVLLVLDVLRLGALMTVEVDRTRSLSGVEVEAAMIKDKKEMVIFLTDPILYTPKCKPKQANQ